SSSNDEEQVPTTEAVPKTALPPKPLVNDLYVDLARLGVREKPDAQAFVERVLYRGDKVKILERKAGFGRITDYF
ncbi:SH3 domain-containing protein, partial [Vibrio anguillarum]